MFEAVIIITLTVATIGFGAWVLAFVVDGLARDIDDMFHGR